MTILEQIKEANELAQAAFASGDKVTGIAAIVLGGQLLQLARLMERRDPSAAR